MGWTVTLILAAGLLAGGPATGRAIGWATIQVGEILGGAVSVLAPEPPQTTVEPTQTGGEPPQGTTTSTLIDCDGSNTRCVAPSDQLPTGN